MTLGWFGLCVLATYRLTRLITADQITEPIRLWAARRSKWLGYLTTCDWCLSIWISPVVAGLAMIWPSEITLLILASLSISGLVGLASLTERRLDL